MCDCHENVVRNLTDSAVGLAKMFGGDAQDDIAKLREQVEDFTIQWSLDERYIEQFDMDVAEFMPESQESGMKMQIGGM